jgi:hypothetical protein
MSPEEFFGTERPFYPRFYSARYSATVDDAISALDDAIDGFVEGAGATPSKAFRA